MDKKEVTVFLAAKGLWDGQNKIELTGEMTGNIDVRNRDCYPVTFGTWNKGQRIDALDGIIFEFPAISEDK